MKALVTFTGLFPSSVMPGHGLFIWERMRRVAEVGGFRWTVIAPVPDVVRPLRRGIYRQWHRVPEVEDFAGVTVHHPRFRHWPGISLRRQAGAVARGARATLRSLAAEGPTVVDAHYVWPDGVAAAELARELGLPFTITARGTDINVIASDRSVAARIAELAPRAEGLFAVSGALGDRFAEVAGVPRDRVVTVRNGVDLERFRPGDAGAARAALGLPAEGRLLVGVGRLVPAKGFVRAARALASLPDDVRLVLVGEGPERRAIAEAAGDRVHFLGRRPPDEVALALRASDVFVLPTDREGWPNVVTEALASGLPVVASAVGGIPEILGAEGAGPVSCGRLVARADERELATGLAEVLRAPPDSAAIRTFAERYGWSEPVGQLVAVFRRALDREVT